ncbi:Cell division protein ZapA [Candidatus Providencia siddallii]|uniref:Cell division protein ZapA n=1 Tax=Candidatus Providencia siddallii TaxID=1715285 RepID=A0A0M6W8V6_9GAMM|nr:Cell division protein ZapA [Candidatus Providencia siddallii]
MSLQPVDIQIFGRLIRIKCPNEQKEDLIKSAKELEHRLHLLKDKSGVTNIEQLIFTVALNICYELAEEKTKTRIYANNMEEKIKILQNTIEQALQIQVKITDSRFLL